MKLLWLTVAPLDSSGYRATQFGMAIALENLGWQVHLMSKSNSSKPFKGFKGFRGKVSLITRKGRLSTEAKYHLLLWKTILCEKVEILMFEPPQLRLIMLPAILSFLKIIKTRFVLDVRTPLVDDAVCSKVLRFNYRFAMRFARVFLSGITVITEGLKKDLQGLLGNYKPVAVWGSAVKPEVFDPKKIYADLRKPLGLETRFVFFYHGALTLTRGLPALLSGVKKLSAEYPQAALVLLGDGPAVDELKQKAYGMELRETVYFLEAVDNSVVPEYLAMADVGVIPLPNERCWQVSSPLKLFEYMSMQLPVVVTDIEAHRVVLADAPFAIYVTEVSPEGFYQALKSAIQRISELRNHARLAREMIVDNYTWQRRATVLSDFLKSHCV